jgi:hypothetical protein
VTRRASLWESIAAKVRNRKGKPTHVEDSLSKPRQLQGQAQVQVLEVRAEADDLYGRGEEAPRETFARLAEDLCLHL